MNFYNRKGNKQFNLKSLIFIPFFFLLLSIFHNSIQKKSRIVFSIVVSFFIIINFLTNLSNYQPYIYKPSQLHYVCVNKSIRDFYYNWARNFDEDFFKKICLNKNLLFK